MVSSSGGYLQSQGLRWHLRHRIENPRCLGVVILNLLVDLTERQRGVCFMGFPSSLGIQAVLGIGALNLSSSLSKKWMCKMNLTSHTPIPLFPPNQVAWCQSRRRHPWPHREAAPPGPVLSAVTWPRGWQDVWAPVGENSSRLCQVTLAQACRAWQGSRVGL